MKISAIFLAAATFAFAASAPSAAAGTAVLSGNAAKWNQPQEPQRIYGDTYYVGVAGLSSVLIHTDAGSILLDGDLPQSPPLIEANIRKLGFAITDVKLILNSHVHFDHAGGIARLQRDSGARVLASPASARALRAGHVSADDPQAADADVAIFPAVANVREIRDGEVVRLGGAALTAHFTPGHTPGGTTWTWDACEESRCMHVVYADSLTPIAAPGFHFRADAAHPDLTRQFAQSIRTLATLPCDILITVHPDVAGLPKKLAGAAAGATPNPFVDAQACAAVARDAQQRLDARIGEEQAAAAR